MSFAHYLLQVNLYLIVFYGFYKLLLDKETYFILNRIYLVAAGILSACIPFIRLEWITEQEAAKNVYTSVNWDTVLQQATIVTEDKSVLSWTNAFIIIYCAGVLFFLGRLVFNLLAVKNLINSAGSGSAFSFFSQKIIDKNLPLADVIDVHEDAHIKQWHTVDILFFEVLGILTWINPIIYLYKKSIKNIHEFLADQQAAAFQGDKAEYAMLILSQSFGISPNKLTNGFFDQSLIKKRIFMLQKEKSKKTAIMKYGVFIPLFAILIVFSSATIRKNKELMALSDKIPLERPIEVVQDMVAKTDLINKESAKSIISPPTDKLNGNWSLFYRFMGGSIKYPSEARKNNLQGNTQIKFTLQNNKVTNVSTVLDLGDGCDEEVMKALLSYKGFKDLPNGKYTLKVGFKLSNNDARIQNAKALALPNYQKLSDITVISYSQPLTTDNANKKSDKVYDFVSIEKQPEFPGGITRFYKYLGGNIKYPKMAQENNVQGKVFLSFVVEKDGSLTDVQITRGLGSGTDEEAVRVIKESPKWNPGIADGEPVRVKYNLNVNFNLTSDEEKLKTDPTSKMSLRSPKTQGNSGDFNGLLIIDGVKAVDNKALNTINPNDIESINVLKNNTAINLYGLKAKDGVLLVTTKKVKSGLFRKPDQIELTIEKKSTYDDVNKKF
ncbi:TonB family protein [Pedobacter petrophilus]|uniref:TonB family protein n=1 Tax=Pedobacter petrophilus TaxID=1908241 RepID=A0A7K0G1R8_9SPHI|nr:M56 family metallopeptidase [Pedobacter petrophilus]MRX76916.1 TonB family protein [Pedobacter petrophilus]